VVLFAANEPITISGSRAQRILQRRINQAVAEVLQTLEPVLGWAIHSRTRRLQHRQTPYGYQASDYRHPNPAKAARGQTKMRSNPTPTPRPR
jgi:site-specific DNA recombinase